MLVLLLVSFFCLFGSSTALKDVKCHAGQKAGDRFNNVYYEYTCGTDGFLVMEGCITRVNNAEGKPILAAINETRVFEIFERHYTTITCVEPQPHTQVLPINENNEIKCPKEAPNGVLNHTFTTFQCINNVSYWIGCKTETGAVVQLGQVELFKHDTTKHMGIYINCSQTEPTMSARYEGDGCHTFSNSGQKYIPVEDLTEQNLLTICVKSTDDGEHYLIKVDSLYCNHKGKFYKSDQESAIDDGQFVFFCERGESEVPGKKGAASKFTFLHCQTPKRVKVTIGESKEENGKKYTCKSDSELIVE